MTKIGAITPKTTAEILKSLRIADENRRFLIERGVGTAADTFGKTLLDHAYEKYNPETIENIRADGERTAVEIHGATWLDIVNEKINNCLMQLFHHNKQAQEEIAARYSDSGYGEKYARYITADWCENLLKCNNFKTAAEIHGETGLDFVERMGKSKLASDLRRKGAQTAAEKYGATVMDIVHKEKIRCLCEYIAYEPETNKNG